MIELFKVFHIHINLEKYIQFFGFKKYDFCGLLKLPPLHEKKFLAMFLDRSFDWFIKIVQKLQALKYGLANYISTPNFIKIGKNL